MLQRIFAALQYQQTERNVVLLRGFLELLQKRGGEPYGPCNVSAAKVVFDFEHAAFTPLMCCRIVFGENALYKGMLRVTKDKILPNVPKVRQTISLSKPS